MFVPAVISDYDFVFVENGLVAWKDGQVIGKANLRTELGEEKLKGGREAKGKGPADVMTRDV